MKKTIAVLSACLMGVSLTAALPLGAAAENEVLLCYSFDNATPDGVTDDTGLGKAMTKVGTGAVSIVDGVKGKAVSFDGASAYLMDSFDLDLGKAYTLSTYFKLPVHTTQGRLFGTGGFGASPGFWVRPGDGWLWAGGGNSTANLLSYADSNYSAALPKKFDGQWHNLTMTVDFENKVMRLFIDGQPEAVHPWDNPDVVRGDDGVSVTFSGEYTASDGQSFCFGAGGSGDGSSGEFSEVMLDEFVIYKGAMNQNEVRALLGMGEVTTTIAPPVIEPTDPESTTPAPVPGGNNDFPNNLEMPALRDAAQKQLEAVIGGGQSEAPAADDSLPLWILTVVSLVLAAAGGALGALSFVKSIKKGSKDKS